ncbi:cadherin-related family member 3 [Tachyglossus aculeatus]|uniref:cadherin-related family member 3 n=1 Tax=Tachyglossus aculeatus TaxID=9261 RepID=UPI0018F610F1|nr:cadherin-related family member 3 [Tachyglossus aculeatus]
MQANFILLVLLGAMPGRDSLQFTNLPGLCRIAENSKPRASPCNFSVTPSEAEAPLSDGYPLIINSSPLTRAFAVDVVSDTSFRVVATGNPPLDFETMPNRFELQIYVKDEAGATDLQTLTVEVEDVDEPPVFQGNLAQRTVELYVLEGTPPGALYQVEATDPEVAAPLTYSLGSPSDPFSISQTGTLASTATFDFESGPRSYMPTVVVTDQKGLSANRTFLVFIVDINDEAPRFTSARTSYTIPEEQRAGSFVANVTARDPDDDGFPSRLLYSIDPPSQYFVINQLTGTVYVAKRLDRDAAPWRRDPSLTLEILVRDRSRGGHESRTHIAVTLSDINDLPPICAQDAFRVEVLETLPAGSQLLDLRRCCHDADAEEPNRAFSFSGLSGAGSHRFRQDPEGSGNILVSAGTVPSATPGSLGPPRRFGWCPRASVISVYVQASPVNEFPLAFDPSTYVFQISEVKPAGWPVGQVCAADRDRPRTEVTYSLLNGDAALQKDPRFWIQPRTGVLQLLTRLDYESSSQHVLAVQAASTEGSSTATVTVQVLEENDEKPVCEPNFSLLTIPAQTAVGTPIQNFRLTCTDRDSSPGALRYTIGSGNVNNRFAFSPDAGSNVTSLLLASPFDPWLEPGGPGEPRAYRLLVRITDDNLLTGGKKAVTPVETGTVTLSIRVIPAPTPRFTTTSTPRVTYLIRRENSYSSSAWYVPFVIALGSLLLLGLLGHLLFHLARFVRGHWPCLPKADKEPPVKKAGKKKAKKEVVLEITKINTIFDGEAVDPVTGKTYEFNSKSGARRWKEAAAQAEPARTEPARAEAAQAVGLAMPGGTSSNRAGAGTPSSGPGPTPHDGGPQSVSGRRGPNLPRPVDRPAGRRPSPSLSARASPKIHPHTPPKLSGK